jgi:protein subunit release factor A
VKKILKISFQDTKIDLNFSSTRGGQNLNQQISIIHFFKIRITMYRSP